MSASSRSWRGSANLWRYLITHAAVDNGVGSALVRPYLRWGRGAPRLALADFSTHPKPALDWFWALVGTYAVGALHTLPGGEAPSAGRPAIGRVVTAQHERRALLRRLHRRQHQARALEHDVYGRDGEIPGVAQPEPAQRQERILPQRRQNVATLHFGLGHGHERELHSTRARALR